MLWNHNTNLHCAEQVSAASAASHTAKREGWSCSTVLTEEDVLGKSERAGSILRTGRMVMRHRVKQKNSLKSRPHNGGGEHRARNQGRKRPVTSGESKARMLGLDPIPTHPGDYVLKWALSKNWSLVPGSRRYLDMSSALHTCPGSVSIFQTNFALCFKDSFMGMSQYHSLGREALQEQGIHPGLESASVPCAGARHWRHPTIFVGWKREYAGCFSVCSDPQSGFHSVTIYNLTSPNSLPSSFQNQLPMAFSLLPLETRKAPQLHSKRQN